MQRETGVLVIVHGDYGVPLVQAAEILVGPLDVEVTMVCQSDDRVSLRRRIDRKIEAVDRGAGVLMLVDLCGSTPANCCLDVALERPGCEVLTGLSLPMLVKLATCDRAGGANVLARELRDTAKRSVVVVSERSESGGQLGG